MLARLRTLTQDATRARSVRAVDLLRHDALGAKPARIGEHGRPMFDNVFVKQDASLSVAQERR
jgi:hypothetical protein